MFWQDYKFTNPLSKKIEPKSLYREKLDDAWSAAASTSRPPQRIRRRPDPP